MRTRTTPTPKDTDDSDSDDSDSDFALPPPRRARRVDHMFRLSSLWLV
jgi:hypothetical protein